MFLNVVINLEQLIFIVHYTLSCIYFYRFSCHHSEHPLEFFPPHIPNSLPSLPYWYVHYFFHTTQFFAVNATSCFPFSYSSFLWYMSCWIACQDTWITFPPFFLFSIYFTLFIGADKTSLRFQCTSTHKNILGSLYCSITELYSLAS